MGTVYLVEQTAEFVTHMLGSIDPECADGADTTLMPRELGDAAGWARDETNPAPGTQTGVPGGS